MNAPSDGLIAKALATAEEKERERQAAAAEDARIERIKEAGPELLKALSYLESCVCAAPDMPSRFINEPCMLRARSLIHQLEAKP